MTKKYKLTDNEKVLLGHTLHQIKALKDFGYVNKGDLGGWVENYDNLSQKGTAWVFNNAKVYDHAYVFGNAWVCGDVEVYGNAWVYGHAWVYGNAQVFGNAWVCDDAIVYDNARVYDNAIVGGHAWVYGHAQVNKAKLSGEIYELYLNVAENLVKTQQQLGKEK